MTVPLLKGGRWVASLGVHGSRPRQWTDLELMLVEQTAERTWAALERAKAQAALHESEHFIRGVIRSLPLAIYIFDLVEQRNRYLSPQVAQLFNYTPEQMRATDNELINTFFHPEDRPRLSAHLALIRASLPASEDHTGVLAITYRINHPQRGWIWVESRDRVYERDADGRPTLLLGTAEDITQRMSRDQEVIESEKRLRLAIEATELATWEWNLETNQVYWNEQHFRLFGMTPRPNPLSPEEFMNHVHPRDQPRIHDLLARAIAERSVYDTEFCAVREDGSQRWMSGYGRVTEEREGRPIRMSGVMFDVDERRRAEDALKAADQRKDEFLAMLAHELRNPMATIRSGLQVLSITGGDDEITRTTITRMNRQTDQLVRMMDDLLDVSRISRGRIELQPERVDLVTLVGQAVESLQTQFMQQGKVLQVSLPSAALELEGDATRLTQIVTNLLTNSLRYTGEDGQVWLSLHQESTEAMLQVRDNGIGLAEDHLSTIFELFVQVDNSVARSKGGLGLGLTLVKRLVELHGGRVDVQSDGLGQGSTFTVYLPTLTTAALPPAPPAPAAANIDQSPRIVVVDDNADAAYTIAMLLKLKGYNVTTRNSGRAGIEAAEEIRPAAILLDLGMPELDGYATCRMIRQQSWGQDVVVLALTGYGQPEDRERTQAAGFDGHLVKPVDLPTLIKLLSDLLNKNHSQ